MYNRPMKETLVSEKPLQVGEVVITVGREEKQLHFATTDINGAFDSIWNALEGKQESKHGFRLSRREPVEA